MVLARSSRLWRPLASLLLLCGLWLWLEPGEVIDAVGPLAPGWILLALALTLPQMLLSAWRWRLTASRLELSLSWGRALREYYLAMFLNQVLPGGVAGDATRAWRHSRASGRRGSAWRAVIIERASGQLAMLVLTLLVVAISPLWQGLIGEALASLSSPGWLIGATLMLVIGVPVMRHLVRQPPAALAGLGEDLRRSLLASSVWPRQLAGSLLVVLSYALVFVCAARAIGVTLPLGTLMSLVPPVLIAMLIPLSLAGWGLREGAAALVWGLVGLAPAEGVAVSMAYGLLVLLASLPGAMFLPGLVRRFATPSDVGALDPDGSGPGEVQIEEGIIAAAEGPRDGTTRLVQGGDGRHGQPRPAGADQQWCHQQVQAIEHAGLQESRDRDAATLDQHAPQAPVGKRLEHVGSIKAVGCRRQLHAGDVLGRRLGDIDLLADQVQAGGLGFAQQTDRRWHPAPRVEDHPYRLPPADVSHREQGIVLAGGAGADHHGINQRPQPVQMCPALEAVDVVGMPALGGNASIQALAELGQSQSAGMHRQRDQIVEQFPGIIVRRNVRRPSAGRQAQRAFPVHRRRGTGHALSRSTEGQPGRRLVQGVGQGRGHEGSGPGQSKHHAQSASAEQGMQGGHHASG
ncbi:conserved hypothetical protein [Halomonas daqiaonensis]|uniref:Lysylphosphatidylglycerol synthase TM region n=1 Tax=Halomonas daqiaonensis TaxID=650850 RepID=A0A1H7TCW8_9GAMM|nr:conserved hypothetical protein [Halomonas daqiaonensis]